MFFNKKLHNEIKFLKNELEEERTENKKYIDEIEQQKIIPESVTSLHHIAQALDSTAVRKIPAEPMGAAKIIQFHRKTNILHSVFTLKSRIQVIDIEIIKKEKELYKSHSATFVNSLKGNSMLVEIRDGLSNNAAELTIEKKKLEQLDEIVLQTKESLSKLSIRASNINNLAISSEKSIDDLSSSVHGINGPGQTHEHYLTISRHCNK